MEDLEEGEDKDDANSVQKTDTQAKATDTKEVAKKDKKTQDNKDDENEEERDPAENEIDLVDDYQQFLKNKE